MATVAVVLVGFVASAAFLAGAAAQGSPEFRAEFQFSLFQKARSATVGEFLETGTGVLEYNLDPEGKYKGPYLNQVTLADNASGRIAVEYQLLKPRPYTAKIKLTVLNAAYTALSEGDNISREGVLADVRVNSSNVACKVGSTGLLHISRSVPGNDVNYVSLKMGAGCRFKDTQQALPRRNSRIQIHIFTSCLRPTAAVGKLRVPAARTPLCGSGNLIKNGGFETPIVPAGSYTNFSTGSGFEGWSVVGAPGDVSIVSGSYASRGLSFPAHSGAQWLDLTGYLSNSKTGVAQTVATTPGAQYRLEFWVGNVADTKTNVFGTTSTVDVLVDGTQIMAAVNSAGTDPGTQVWEKFTTTITATSGTTEIEFLNGDPPSDNSNGLDDVSLTRLG